MSIRRSLEWLMITMVKSICGWSTCSKRLSIDPAKGNWLDIAMYASGNGSARRWTACDWSTVWNGVFCESNAFLCGMNLTENTENVAGTAYEYQENKSVTDVYDGGGGGLTDTQKEKRCKIHTNRQREKILTKKNRMSINIKLISSVLNV